MYRKKEEAGQNMLILCCWMFYACSLHLSFLILFALGRIILIQMVITEPLRLHFFYRFLCGNRIRFFQKCSEEGIFR